MTDRLTAESGPARILLDDLTPAQHRAVITDASPVCILAGAGAGKTRVLTRRIAYRVHTGTADARHVLALTFTRKAAGELSSRLRQLGLRDQVSAGTFHAIAAAQLRRWWADRGQRPPVLLERKARLLGPLADERRRLAGVDIADLAGQIEWAKARGVSPDGYEAAVASLGAHRRQGNTDPAEIAALYQRYEHEKRRRGLIDFDDLLEGCAQAMERDLTFAGAQRWRWRHVFVDEFQDVNPLQHRLLLAWLGTAPDLCVVGDPNQAIYGWNGADPGLLDRFGERWPTAEVVRLDENHRSTPQVVAVAAGVLGDEGRALRSSRPEGPDPEIRSYPSDQAEAEGVARQLAEARDRGLGWSRMAVLVRTNAQAVPFQRALKAAGIPYRTAGGGGLLDDRAVRDALADLRGRVDIPFQMMVADLERSANGETEESSGSRPDAAPIAPLLALAALAREYQRLDDQPTVAGFCTWLPTSVSEENGGIDGQAAVTLSSFHRAKGLEWSAVWVCGLERGLVPIGPAHAPSAQSEERRLLYVALTRSERELRCSWARQRHFGGRAVPREPSPWLTLLTGPSSVTPETLSPPMDPETWRARLREQRTRLASGDRGRPTGRRSTATTIRLPEPDPVVVTALRAWRSSQARASAVPAHLLLHDVTLAALAALRPTTPEELLAVPGLGPVKAGRYGTTLLSLIADQHATA